MAPMRSQPAFVLSSPAHHMVMKVPVIVIVMKVLVIVTVMKVEMTALKVEIRGGRLTEPGLLCLAGTPDQLLATVEDDLSPEGSRHNQI